MSENPYIVAGDALQGTSCSDYEVSSAIVDALYDAGLLYMGPRIIRTVEELEALDPDTVVCIDREFATFQYADCTVPEELPAAAIRDGAEVRAARKALEKETNND